MQNIFNNMIKKQSKNKADGNRKKRTRSGKKMDK